MRLVVGLGNPGSEYVGTRHNVGFAAVELLAENLGWIPRGGDFSRHSKHKFDALAMEGPAGAKSEKLLLLEPLTYMNLSGRSVQAVMAFYQLSPADILIVLDDIALPCGKLRLRPGGSSGGHNGLKDIERALGTDQYPRLRIGVDAPPARVPQKDYVLGRFSGEQLKKVEPTLDRVASAVLTWIDGGIELAMNRFNADAEPKD
jgi:PTH1 family peptidyl-tRNA hydrolase